MSWGKIKVNYQGMPCKDCGEIIEVYSLSGHCRECFHKRRGGVNSPQRYKGVVRNCNCPKCGRFQTTPDVCPDCKHKTPGYLAKYRLLTVNSVPRGEHRIIWEKTHGPIPTGWVIHHLNGFKGDNRLENLVAVPKGDHDSKAIISALEERIRELEASLVGQ